jgi:OmpA-OmpF porin, OOP family
VDWQAPLPPVDRDGDSVLDSEDACPDVAGPRTGDPATNGCPPPPDRDGDGVADPQDACPDTKGFPSTDPRTNGCPPPPPPDTDKDGVLDRDDACPEKAGVANADPKKNGCPPDKDNDGFADAEDACPEVVGVADPDPKKNGCPADKDADGIPDSQDACPDAAGPADPDPKKNGCPPARIEGAQIKILEQVKFKTRSAKILPESDSIITAVAEILKAHPEIKLVRIEGHTDSQGSNAYNQRLSGQRAASVLKALVGKGIGKERMRSRGLGEERPIDSNDTDAGRQNNRRVEFHIE